MPEPMTPLCPMCPGKAQELGSLGHTRWFRCQACGWEFGASKKPKPLKNPTAHDCLPGHNDHLRNKK